MTKIIPFTGFVNRVETKLGFKGTRARQWIADFFGIGIATVYRHEHDKAHVVIDETAKKTILVVEKASVSKVL